MTSHPPDDATTGRRAALRKLALGGAVAWSAPVMFSSTASAQQGGSPPPTTTTTSTAPAVCVGAAEWVCGDPAVRCGRDGLYATCVCDVDMEGNSICWANFPCGDPRAATCTANADCPDGWACATTCCGTTCVPPCDGTYVVPPRDQLTDFNDAVRQTAAGI